MDSVSTQQDRGTMTRRPIVWTDRAKMLATIVGTLAAAALVSALFVMLAPAGVR